jgi:hypothetical protein
MSDMAIYRQSSVNFRLADYSGHDLSSNGCVRMAIYEHSPSVQGNPKSLWQQPNT